MKSLDLSADYVRFGTAPHIGEAAKRALDEGATHYTTRPGLDPLREAVAEKLQRENGIAVDPKSEVLITCGAQEALFVTLHVLLSPGDEVVVPQPSNPAYAALVRHAHGIARVVPGDARHGFELDPQGVRSRLGRRSRALILSSPAVPAGTIVGEPALRRLAELAIERNLLVVADESYESLVLDGPAPRSIASLPGMAERTVTINGFSVPYGMWGWRVGYVAGPKSLIGPIMQLKQALSICSPAVSQYAALAALTGPEDAVRQMRSILQKRRDAVCEALSTAGIPHVRPDAGPFVLLSGERTGLARTALARQVARETGVSLAAGSRFGRVSSSWLRLTLGEEPETLCDAARRLQPLLGVGLAESRSRWLAGREGGAA